MDEKLLKLLSVITAEEQEILDGRRDIDRSIYHVHALLNKTDWPIITAQLRLLSKK